MVWLKSHADGSRHTLRAYERIGRRFRKALAAAGLNLKRATVEDVQTALEAMRTKADGSTSSAATVNTYVAAVKALLGFAHKVGFTRFNSAPLIKLRKAPRKTAQRLRHDPVKRTELSPPLWLPQPELDLRRSALGQRLTIHPRPSNDLPRSADEYSSLIHRLRWANCRNRMSEAFSRGYRWGRSDAAPLTARSSGARYL